MTQKPTTEQEPPQSAPKEKAFRIIYKRQSERLDSDGKNLQELCSLSEPGTTVAYLEALQAVPDWATELAGDDTAGDTKSGAAAVQIIWLPPGSKLKESMEKRLSQGTSKTWRLSGKTAECLLSHNRALVVSDQGLMNDLLKLLAGFFHLESSLIRVEETISKHWDTLSNDLRFTHRVSEKDVAEWHHVQNMTTMSGELRILLERLSPAYSGLEDWAPPAVQKLAAQLVDELLVEDRCEAASDRLEIFQETYELANDRISEFSYFSTEAKLEIWIIVILVLELVFMLAEIAVTLWAHT